MAKAAVIVDTGPLVALLDEGDRYHSWAVEELTKLNGPLLTCEAVLSEACHLLDDAAHPVRGLGQWVKRGRILVQPVAPGHTMNVFALMETDRNIPMSFADGCIISTVERNPGSAVFTIDSDFKYYRQHRRRLIPLIAPF